MVGVGFGPAPECCSACWGAPFSSGACPPRFIPGKLHFKNKFCDSCRTCILVPLTYVHALSRVMPPRARHSLAWLTLSSSGVTQPLARVLATGCNVNGEEGRGKASEHRGAEEALSRKLAGPLQV